LTWCSGRITLNPKKPITVRSVGSPNLALAAELLAPLFLKIHERNEAQVLARSKRQARAELSEPPKQA